jgi:hypothetical protein
MSAFPLPAFRHSPSLHVPWSLGLRVSRPLENYPKILYLFTRSDLKTILLPVVRPYIYPLIHIRSPPADPFCLPRIT